MNTKTIRLKNKKIIVPIVLIILLTIIFSMQSEYFLTTRNIMTLFREGAVPCMLAIALSFIVACGEIDVSIGAILGLMVIICGRLLENTPLPFVVVAILVIFCGSCAGMLNCFIIRRFHMNPFIATTAMTSVYRGLISLFCFRDESGNALSMPLTNKTIRVLDGKIGQLYFSVIALLIIVAIAQVVYKCTKFGLNVTALGSNRNAAVLSGINAGKTMTAVFAISGGICGIAALFTVGRLMTITTSIGVGMEFTAIAANAISGAALFGKSKGGGTSAVGALIGAIFMMMITNGIYKINIDSSFQNIFQGLALMFAFSIDALIRVIRTRKERA